MARESNTQAEKAKHDVALVCTLEITPCRFSFGYSAVRKVFRRCVRGVFTSIFIHVIRYPFPLGPYI